MIWWEICNPRRDLRSLLLRSNWFRQDNKIRRHRFSCVLHSNRYMQIFFFFFFLERRHKILPHLLNKEKLVLQVTRTHGMVITHAIQNALNSKHRQWSKALPHQWWPWKELAVAHSLPLHSSMMALNRTGGGALFCWKTLEYLWFQIVQETSMTREARLLGACVPLSHQSSREPSKCQEVVFMFAIPSFSMTDLQSLIV